MQFIQRLRMGGLLSFPPDMDFFELQPLNVLIGPNASGKTNFIEVLELLRATPTDFAAAIRDGGGADFYYTFQQGHPVNIRVRTPGEQTEVRTLQSDELSLDQSVLRPDI